MCSTRRHNKCLRNLNLQRDSEIFHRPRTLGNLTEKGVVSQLFCGGVSIQAEELGVPPVVGPPGGELHLGARPRERERHHARAPRRHRRRRRDRRPDGRSRPRRRCRRPACGLAKGTMLLDLVPHVLGSELLAAAGAGRAHREGRAAGDADVAGLLRRDRERHRRVPVRRPVA
jgi:hypothetical protein